MRSNLKYALRLKRELRAVDKELKTDESQTENPLLLLQSLARHSELKDERKVITDLMQNMRRNLGFVWW